MHSISPKTSTGGLGGVTEPNHEPVSKYSDPFTTNFDFASEGAFDPFNEDFGEDFSHLFSEQVAELPSEDLNHSLPNPSQNTTPNGPSISPNPTCHLPAIAAPKIIPKFGETGKHNQQTPRPY